MKKSSFDGNFERIPVEFIEDLPNVGFTAFGLYCFLYHNINDSKGGYSWPSYNYIMEKTGISNRNILSKAIKKLIETGWIEEKTKRLGKSNEYTLNYSKNVNQELVERTRELEEIAKKSKGSIKSDTSSTSIKSDTIRTAESDGGSIKSDTTIVPNQLSNRIINDTGSSIIYDTGVVSIMIHNKDLDKDLNIKTYIQRDGDFSFCDSTPTILDGDEYTEQEISLFKSMLMDYRLRIDINMDDYTLTRYKKWVKENKYEEM